MYFARAACALMSVYFVCVFHLFTLSACFSFLWKAFQEREQGQRFSAQTFSCHLQLPQGVKLIDAFLAK